MHYVFVLVKAGKDIPLGVFKTRSDAINSKEELEDKYEGTFEVICYAVQSGIVSDPYTFMKAIEEL